jgi:cyclophilin family peptidyl-prolyl cis-trans isomerase
MRRYVTDIASPLRIAAAIFVAVLCAPASADDPAPSTRPPTFSEVLAAAKDSDWRDLDAANTLYLQLAGGTVVIELAPDFAPHHVDNIKALVREKYFDGLAILRSHDNYVVQWGDPNAADPDKARKMKDGKRTLAAEFSRGYDEKLAFDLLPDGDGYAPEVGFSHGFWAARDAKAKQVWLTHCYGAVGAGRDVGADSGGGSELYVVIGHAPRHLDRNVTLVGRVVQGIELLSTLPRGSGALGFYEKPEQHVAIASIRVAGDLPEPERLPLQAMRTDTATWTALLESRRNRRDEWYLHAAGHVELCNVPLPVRRRPEP